MSTCIGLRDAGRLHRPQDGGRGRRHIRPLAVAVSGLVVWGLSGSVCPKAAHAGDVKAGRAKAMTCQGCHGLDGLSKTPDSPNLAGQPEPYLVAQLQAFKSGARKSEAMSVVAPNLSDADIDDLAAYYAAIEISVGQLPGE